MYSGRNATLIDVLAAARTLPMFAKQRLVIARGLEQVKAEGMEPLTAYAAHPNPSTCLVLLAEKVDGRLRAFLALRKAGFLHEFARLKDRDLGPFIAREAKTRGLAIDSDAAEALANAAGLVLKCLAYGGIINELHVPDRAGNTADVVLGFRGLPGYLGPHPFFGTITGRVAGRITGGRFQLDGRDYQLAINDPPNHLHGGPVGFDQRLWQAEVVATPEGGPGIRLTYASPHGEIGSPCPLPFWGCLECSNAVITARKIFIEKNPPRNLRQVPADRNWGSP